MPPSHRQIAEQTMASYPEHTFFNTYEQEGACFSWQKCELCGGLAGDRWNVSAVIVGKPDHEKDLLDFEVCDDCRYYIEYGEASPEYFEGED